MLDIKQIYKTFNAGTPNEVRALRGVNLTIDDGSFVVVIGTNGSGKSTLLTAIAGGFPARCRRDDSRRHRRDQVARAPPREDHRPGLPEPVQRDGAVDVDRREPGPGGQARPARALGWALKRSARSEFRDRVRTLNMGLEERLDNPIGSLSGGQRQALTLLMASWLKPKLLLLDEHTAALDPKSADQVIRLSEAIVARDKLTTLMVTHSMSQAASLGDRLVMMNRGSVLHDFRGAEKQRLRAGDLLNRFEDVRRAELLDEPAAGMLRRLYV